MISLVVDGATDYIFCRGHSHHLHRGACGVDSYNIWVWIQEHLLCKCLSLLADFNCYSVLSILCC